jgi:alanine-synthesizing transaminase
LIGDEGLIVHPGYFFDMPRDGYLVLSLLPPPEPFADAVERLCRRLDQG